MANDLVKMTNFPIGILGDSLKTISNTILEGKREEAKTERLEIRAKVYMAEKAEETKIKIAELMIEDNKDRRTYEERMARLNNEKINNYLEYNYRIEQLIEETRKNKEKIENIKELIQQNSQIKEIYIKKLRENPHDKIILEILKEILKYEEKLVNIMSL